MGHYQGAGDSGSGIGDPGGLRHDKCGPPNGGHTTAVEGKDRSSVGVIPGPAEHKWQDRRRLGSCAVDLEGTV